jgi:hypothetical protein
MHHHEIAGLMTAIAPVVGDFVSKAVAPLRAQNTELLGRLDAIEQRFASFPSKEENSVLILRLVQDEVAKVPPVAPKEVDPAEIDRVVAEKVASVVAALPAPEPGKDADPALVLQLVEETVAKIASAQPGKDADPAEVAHEVARVFEDNKNLYLIPIEEVRALIERKLESEYPALIASTVASEVAKIPAPAPGRDADPELVAVLVEKAVAARKPAKDGEPGKSVTIEELVPMVLAEVERAVADLPKPKDGKDVDPEEVDRLVSAKLGDALAALPPAEPVKDADPASILDIVERAVAALPPAKDGEPGKSVTVADLAHLVEEEVSKAVGAIELPVVSIDAAEVERVVAEKVGEAIATIRVPRDGKDVDPEEVAALVAREVEKAVLDIPVPKDGIGLAGALIDREGHLVVTLTDGSTKTLGVVVGKDVELTAVAEMVRSEVAKIPVPKDGSDGVGFDNMDVIEIDGDVMLRFTRGDTVKDFIVPVPTDRGIWTERKFKKGAGVTWAGSFWIAQKDTAAKPDTPDSGWRLAVKRGRDGASAYDVARKAGFKGTEREWLDSLRPKPLAPVKAG